MAAYSSVVRGASEFGCIDALDAVIRESINIPDELRNNMEIKMTELGGVILEYYSLGRQKNKNRSNVIFSIYFDTGSAFGTYDATNIRIKVLNYKNIKMLHCSDICRPYQKVLNKVNRWIVLNKDYLINSIEH